MLVIMRSGTLAWHATQAKTSLSRQPPSGWENSDCDAYGVANYQDLRCASAAPSKQLIIWPGIACS